VSTLSRLIASSLVSTPAEAPKTFGGRTPMSNPASRNYASDNYVIEVRPNAVGITVQAGIVVRDGGRFRFFAATGAFNSLEGQLFKSPREAEKAALRHVATVASPRLSAAGAY
jgi:hypothetical protein